MVKLVRSVVIVLAVLSSASVFAYSQDTGKIATIYTSPDGVMSFTMVGGFPNAVSTNQCPGNNGWAGNSTASNVLKAALMTAKGSDLSITVTVSGCDGSWFRILDIYW